MSQTETSIWLYDNLEIDDDGYVTGSAYTRQFLGEYDVVVGVTSYEYERHGETRMNHVPHVVVTDSEGTIVREPQAYDSENPGRAISNAKGLAEFVLENPQDFI